MCAPWLQQTTTVVQNGLHDYPGATWNTIHLIMDNIANVLEYLVVLATALQNTVTADIILCHFLRPIQHALSLLRYDLEYLHWVNDNATSVQTVNENVLRNVFSTLRFCCVIWEHEAALHRDILPNDLLQRVQLTQGVCHAAVLSLNHD
jgi:hypothetical protein